MITIAIIAVLAYVLVVVVAMELSCSGAMGPKKPPDFLASLRPINAVLFVMLWNAPLLVLLLIRGSDSPSSTVNLIMVVQGLFLALASGLILISKRVQRMIFRDGVTLNRIKEGRFVLVLWIGLGIACVLVYRA